MQLEDQSPGGNWIKREWRGLALLKKSLNLNHRS